MTDNQIDLTDLFPRSTFDPEAPAPRIAVLGTGYLGATHAVAMAQLGMEVVGVDTDPNKVAMLTAGKVPFYEPGLPELLTEQLATGRLRFTTDVAEAVGWADVHFVCVGTPQQKGRLAADTSYVEAVVEGLAPHLRPGALVVGKSTVPGRRCGASPSTTAST